MKKISLNENWKYAHIGEDDYKDVTLPHDAMLSEKRTEGSPGGKNTGYFEGRDYIYERVLKLDKKEGSRYVLEFEGVYRNARVYLNGEEIAFRPYGYIGFYVDITDKVLSGENKLEVKAFNADQPNSRWYSGAGIYRPVWLYELPEKHIEINGIRVRTLDYTTGKISVSVATSHGGAVKAEVSDGETIVASGKGEEEIVLHVHEAKLWSESSPYLYTCRVTYEGEVREEKFGIRQIECDSRRGFLVNGEKVLLKGACVHHDNGVLGACAYDEAEERKVKLLKNAGYNAIRSAHNPCSKAILNACDRLGMFVMDEYVDMWYIHKTKYDYATYFDEWWERDLKDIVEKDFNHPSVVMYSIGNEVSETAQKRGIRLSEDMTKYLNDLDGSRPVSCGVNIFFNFLSSIGFGVYSDDKANKTAKDPKKKKKHKAVGSEFFNKLAGLLGDKVMKLGATLRGSDRKSKHHFAKMDVAGYNYGILRYKKDVKKYPERVILGSETFVRDAYTFYEFAKKHNALIGDFVWAGIDYLGEVGLGAMEYKNYAKDFVGGLGWLTAGSGRLDITGRELGEALYTKVAYELLPIAIAVVPADNAGKPHSPSAWGMTNARESWSWNGCDGNTTSVEVYARAYKVRLLVNGKKVGERKIKNDCKAIFKTKYYGGTIEAVGMSKDGQEICRTALSTAGDETVLRIEPENENPKKGGLLFVRLRYTDESGTTKPLARREIELAVEGGKVLGFGNGCPYNERGYLENVSDTYYGEAFAVVRAEGDVKIHATSAFGDAQATIKTEA